MGEPETVTEKKEEKEPAIYKGESVEVSKLPAGVIVQTLPGQRVGKNNEKLPLFMYIETAVKDYRDDWQIQFLDMRNNMRRSYATLDRRRKLNVLTGRMGSELKAEFQEHMSKNIWQYVVWPSGCVGTDPEVFIEDKNGKVIPAWEFLPGKDKPTHVATDTSRYPQGNNPVYWDGFQAEFNTRPTHCLEEQTRAVRYGLSGLYQLAQKHSPGAKLSVKSVIEVSGEELEAASEEHVVFGCTPSLNVYGLEGNHQHGRFVPLRFAGGHLHLGIGRKYDDKLPHIIKTLDKILGVACVSLFDGYDDYRRRGYYGLPGEYRTPPHGIEYRTLSNAWLIHPVAMNMVFDLARRCVGYALCGHEGWNAPEDEVKDVILASNTKGAQAILKRNQKLLESIMQFGSYSSSTDVFFSVLMDGIKSKLKNPNDIAANWDLAQYEWKAQIPSYGKEAYPAWNWRTAIAGGRLSKGNAI